VLIPDAAKMTLASAIERASSARDRAELFRAYAEEWNVSLSTARRDAGVKIRPSTASAPAVDPVMDELVSRWLSTATEKYKTATQPVRDFLEMCERAELIQPGQVSESSFRRYVKAHRITIGDQRRGTPHIHMASPHPNWAHLVDSSRCRQWYLKDDGTFDVQSFKRGTAEYRNKDLRGVPLYRYVCIDHASGLPFVQYYTDETVQTLLTFLASAWLPKRGRVAPGPTGVTRRWLTPFTPEAWDEWKTLDHFRNYPFRGVPRVLVLDRASANQSEFVRELCRRLEVKHQLAQEARAKGAVENFMWTWERSFESRLAVQPATDLATLNIYALDHLEYFCRRSVHSRHGMTRTQAWAQIAPEQLRELDDWPRFADAARRAPKPALVRSGDAGTGWIAYEGRTWRMATANYIGQTVAVSMSAFSPDELVAQTGDGQVFLLEEVGRTKFGFSDRAPVYGEAHASHPMTTTERTRARADRLRETLEPVTVFGREGERTDAPDILGPRRGVEISIASTIGSREITRSELNKRVLAQLGPRAHFDEMMSAKRDELIAGRRTFPEAVVDEFLSWHAAYLAAPDPSRKVVNLFD
jgi:hypothetical protein